MSAWRTATRRFAAAAIGMVLTYMPTAQGQTIITDTQDQRTIEELDRLKQLDFPGPPRRRSEEQAQHISGVRLHTGLLRDRRSKNAIKGSQGGLIPVAVTCGARKTFMILVFLPDLSIKASKLDLDGGSR